MRHHRLFVWSLCIGTLTCGALAEDLPFQSGRFIAGDQDVYNGVYDSVRLDALSIGEGMFRAARQEFIAASAARVYVDATGRGDWRLLTDAELTSGIGPVRLMRQGSVLDAFNTRDLSGLLHTDGTVAVRVDILMTTGIYNNRSSTADRTPELVLLGRFGDAPVRVAAMIGGNVNNPVFADRVHEVAASSLRQNDTGIELRHGNESIPLAAVGFDLGSAFGVPTGVPAIGYRLEIAPGSPSFFTLFGSASPQQVEETETLVRDESNDRANEFGGGGGGAVGDAYGGGVGGGFGHNGISTLGGAAPVQTYFGGRNNGGFSHSGGSSSLPRFRFPEFFFPTPPPVEPPPVDPPVEPEPEPEPSEPGPPPDASSVDPKPPTTPPTRGSENETKPPTTPGTPGTGSETQPPPITPHRDRDIEAGEVGLMLSINPSSVTPTDERLRVFVNGDRDGAAGGIVVSPNVVPAPGALALLGAAALIGRRRRR